MSIKITLKEIANAEGALAELAKFKFKGKTGYDNSKLLKKCTEELEHYTEARQNTIESVGVFDKDQGGFTFPTLAAQQRLRSISEELLAKDVELEASKLTFADVAAQDPTVNFWASLDWAITDPIASAPTAPAE